MRDIPVYVSCKFEMYILKIALVISENVRIAFLYVLSIYGIKYVLNNENNDFCIYVNLYAKLANYYINTIFSSSSTFVSC